MSKCGGGGGRGDDDDDDDIGRMPLQIEGEREEGAEPRDGNTIDQLFPPHDPQ